MTINSSADQCLVPARIGVAGLDDQVGYTRLLRREKYQMAAAMMITSRITHQ